MANHRSAVKRTRQITKQSERNRHIKSTTRSHIRGVREAIHNGDTEEAQKALHCCIKQISRAVSKGIYHRNTGSRYISRLYTQVSRMQSTSGEDASS